MIQFDAREFLARAALVIGSICACFATLEFVVRSSFTLEALYSDLDRIPEIASVGWQRAFVKDYAQAVARGTSFLGNDLLGFSHDSELGWDTPGRVRGGRTYRGERNPGELRVVAIGDSYTFGAEVEAEESYPAFLEKLLPGSQVLNMGVKAYGIDQAVLKYLKHGRQYRPDVVIFGVFGPDYYRTPLSFYRFAKPVFAIAPDTGLQLTSKPIPPPEMAYRELKSSFWPTSYLYQLAYTRFQARRVPALDEYFGRWDPLIESLFEKLIVAAEQDGSRLVFAYIPTGSQLATDAALEEPCCERRQLKSMWEKLKRSHPSLSTVDLMQQLSDRFTRDHVYRTMVFFHDGLPIGHFTPSGNRAVAEILAEHLRQTGDRRN